MEGRHHLFEDEEVVRFLGRVLRERPANAAALRDTSPEESVREADLEALEAAGLIHYRGGEIGMVAPAESAARALIALFERQESVIAEARAILSRLPELERAWTEGANRLMRGIEGRVIVGAMEATHYWVKILAEDPPENAGSAFPSFESMRSFLTPVLQHFAGLIECGELAEMPRLPFRFLLNSRELDDPEYRALLDQLMAGGAEVRLVPVVPLFLFVDRGKGAAIPMTRESTAPGGGIFFENSATVESFSTLFESWWAEARPYPFAADGWESVLELLAEGLTDKQIAAVLGIGLRTVHRRIADASDELGAQGRFDLGMAWARRNS
ncbi:MAG: helix-turn-helix domain-containing protein [Leucobacter sp.]